jgi:hypothetical protein
MRVRLFVSASLLGATAAAHAVTLDGVRDASYTLAAVQTVETQFGDNFSELDAAYTRVEGGNLYLMLTGNLEGNFNKLNIFIDSQAGGENVLTNDVFNGGQNPTNDGWAAKYAGFTFDSGFAADHMLIMRNGNFGGDRFDIDFSGVGTGNPIDFESASMVFGASKTGANANALPIAGIGVAFDNSNVAGVLGGTNAANAAAAMAVTTGIELSIPLTAIGSPAGGEVIKICAMINGSNHDYLSNQFLGGLTAPQGNLGGDGMGGFNGTVGQLDLNDFEGDQCFRVVIPEPASLGLLALASVALLRRR